MADGTYKFVLVRGKVELNPNGSVKRKYGTIQDITERKLFLDKLEKTNKDLVRSNEELDKFVYSLSHDIRGPLISILGVVQILEEDELNESLSASIMMIKNSVYRLDNFIKNVLQYTYS